MQFEELKIFKKVCLVFLAAAPGLTVADAWKFLMDDQFGTRVYVNENSVKNMGNRQFEVTVLENPYNGRVSLIGGKSTTYVKIYNCEKLKVRTLEVKQYSGEMATGEMLMKLDLSNKPAKDYTQDVFFAIDKAVQKYTCK